VVSWGDHLPRRRGFQLETKHSHSQVAQLLFQGKIYLIPETAGAAVFGTGQAGLLLRRPGRNNE
jgi:hypothetical protein